MGREIVYCGDCGRRLGEDDFDRQRARFIDNRPFCSECRPSAPGTSTRSAPPPPLTPRRAFAAAGASPSAASSRRLPLVIGGVAVAAGLIILVVMVLSGGSGGRPPVHPDPPATAQVEDLLPQIEGLEKFAASGAEPDAVLERCDRLRAQLKAGKYRDRFTRVENAAREKKWAAEQAIKLKAALADLRKAIDTDAEFAKRGEILEKIARAKEKAGPGLPEVDKFLSEYNAAFAAFEKKKSLAPVVLGAKEGTRKGKNLQVKQDAGISYLGNWKTADDGVEWTFDAVFAGTHKVELTYACPANNGGDYVLTAGAGQIKGTVEATGDWKKYKTIALGTLVLSQGRVTLSVKPASVKGGGLMNLRTLTLTPIP